MSAINQRGRIARVRKIQHDRAALAAAKAAGHVRLLESNDERLGHMRLNLGSEAGPTTGAVLASRGELAMRLEQAREGLGLSIKGARAASALREQARIGARRDQESAEKLQGRAASAAAREEDRRMAARFRPRFKPKIEAELDVPVFNPPLQGEGDHAKHGGGVSAPRDRVGARRTTPAVIPLHHSPAASGPPPLAGEELGNTDLRPGQVKSPIEPTPKMETPQ